MQSTDFPAHGAAQYRMCEREQPRVERTPMAVDGAGEIPSHIGVADVQVRDAIDVQEVAPRPAVESRQHQRYGPERSAEPPVSSVEWAGFWPARQPWSVRDGC